MNGQRICERSGDSYEYLSGGPEPTNGEIIIREFLKKKIQALMYALLRLVDIVCYDVDLIVFRLDFQIISKIVQK